MAGLNSHFTSRYAVLICTFSWYYCYNRVTENLKSYMQRVPDLHCYGWATDAFEINGISHTFLSHQLTLNAFSLNLELIFNVITDRFDADDLLHPSGEGDGRRGTNLYTAVSFTDLAIAAAHERQGSLFSKFLIIIFNNVYQTINS